jgi:hypothetical protein
MELPMRNATKAVACLLFIFLIDTPASGVTKNPPTVVWKAAKFVDVKSCCAGPPTFVVNVGTASLLMQDTIDLRLAEGPLSVSWAGAFDLRADTVASGRSHTAFVDLRLNVSKTVDTDVTIVFSISGRTSTKRFPRGSALQKDVLFHNSAALSGDTLPVMIQIFGTRKTVSGQILVSIESLDISGIHKKQ